MYILTCTSLKNAPISVSKNPKNEPSISRFNSVHQHSWGTLHWLFMVDCGHVEGGKWSWSTCRSFLAYLIFHICTKAKMWCEFTAVLQMRPQILITASGSQSKDYRYGLSSLKAFRGNSSCYCHGVSLWGPLRSLLHTDFCSDFSILCPYRDSKEWMWW